MLKKRFLIAKNNSADTDSGVLLEAAPFIETKPTTKIAGTSNTYLALLIFVAAVSFYFMTVSGHHYSIDGIAYYQQAKTLLFQGTFRFNPPLVWNTAHFTYTYWSEGLSLAYIPFLAVFAYIVFPNDATFQVVPGNSSALITDAGYRYVSLSNSIFTAITVSLLFLLAVKFGFSQKRAALVAAVYGLASPAAGYHKEDFAQPLATMFQVLGIYLVVLAFQTPVTTRRYYFLALAGLSLGLLTLTRSESLVIVVPFVGLLILWQYRKLNLTRFLLTGVSFVSLLTLILLFHFWVNYIKSGTIMGTQTNQFNSLWDITTFLKSLIGILFSPGRGLVVFFPLVLYVPYGLYLLYREGNRKWAITFGSLIVISFIFYSYWYAWWGGVSWGPRFFVPLFPFFTLIAFWPKRPGRFLVGFKQTILYPLLKLIVILWGFITALGGTLLQWYRFETTGLPLIKDDPTAIYYRLESNLIWMRWQSFLDWRGFDLYAINHLRDGQTWRLIAVVILGAIFLLAAGLTRYLVDPRKKYW